MEDHLPVANETATLREKVPETDGTTSVTAPPLDAEIKRISVQIVTLEEGIARAHGMGVILDLIETVVVGSKVMGETEM